jgi:hypothetical protein
MHLVGLFFGQIRCGISGFLFTLGQSGYSGGSKCLLEGGDARATLSDCCFLVGSACHHYLGFGRFGARRVCHA